MKANVLSHAIIRREWFGHYIYPLLFCFSLLVSLGAYLTLDSLQTAVDDYINDNQKAMVGGDVVVTSRQEFPAEVNQWAADLPTENVVRDRQFNAMTYAGDASLLVRVKAVDVNYPLYGELKLANGSTLAGLKPGQVLVERQVLTGLGLQIGDQMTLGESQLMIADEILEEPDRPLTAFGFGARVMMLNNDLEATGLMGQRSRVNYRLEIKSSDEQSVVYLNQLNKLTAASKINVTSVNDAQTSISTLSTNFLKFLKLLVVAVIVLSGVGLMSVVKAFVNRQQHTNAIRRAIGEPIKQLKNAYYRLFLIMTLAAVVLAYGLSQWVLYFGYDAFAAIIPAQVTLSISWLSVIKVLVIAAALTLLMTHSTIQSLSMIKPVAVLQQQKQTTSGWYFSKYWLILSGACLYLLMSLELSSWWLGLQVSIGLLLISVVFWFFSQLILRLLKMSINRQWINHWLFKLSIQNIFRKGNQSMLFFTTMSMAVMVMWSIAALNHTIDQQLISTYPEDSPNMFILDVQSDQHETLDELIVSPVTYYPVIRARIESVKGVPAETLKDQLGNYDNISRIFNLSYGNEILPTEQLIESQTSNRLYTIDESQTASGAVPISILDSFAEYLQVSLNDEVVFDIQGVPVKAYISSVRSRYQRGPSPFFYFMFQPEAMANAPQIQFATAKVDAEVIPQLQTTIAKQFPGITTLNGASIAKQLKGFVDQLTQLVQIFTGLSVVAGVMILVTSLVSTSQDRLQESAYFRLMGMLTKDLYAINVIELLLLGMLAFVSGGLLGLLVSYGITTYWFALPFVFPWVVSVWSLVVLMGILLLVSYLYGRFVIKSNVMNMVRQLV
ncbi:ABC transporter permease [Marinicella litoralis]|uniref:Putative ABC transport system permease protein n=1 Tax=Marinicella litoralis TaxID=644220 RepID=A0A4R6XMW7_9GAMM|nr:FtsX-like permease family protein [Marinicella litoralis]TDR19460.1 putative ABC transport system permease protein [Marinicella litoralis]